MLVAFFFTLSKFPLCSCYGNTTLFFFFFNFVSFCWVLDGADSTGCSVCMDARARQ